MSMTKEEKLKELLKEYECKFHSFPSFDSPHGCTDCYNTGYILDSLEINMLVDYDSENNELKSKLKAQQELIDKIEKENKELKDCVDWYAVCDDVGVKARKTLAKMEAR